jgi:6-phosphogluconate dehydrogenase
VPAWTDDSSISHLQLISRVSNEQNWDVKLSECLRIWKAGCIIRSGGMTSFLEPIFKQNENLPNPLVLPEIAQELSRNYTNLKSICAVAIEADAVAPTLQATLEYLKGFGNKQLPTNFTAMQCVSPLFHSLGTNADPHACRRARMDAFGWHKFDLKSEQKPDAVKGDHQYVTACGSPPALKLRLSEIQRPSQHRVCPCVKPGSTATALFRLRRRPPHCIC